MKISIMNAGHVFRVFGVLAIFIFISGCSNESEPFEEGNLDMSYYPLEVGNSWTYRSDSIRYSSEGNQIDTFSGFIRETITDNFIDNAGDSVFRIQREFKRNLTDSWEISDIWVSSISGLSITKTEENLKFIKLVFPLTENRAWDGTAFIDTEQQFDIAGGERLAIYRNWSSKIESLDNTVTIEAVSYPDVAEVTQASHEDQIDRRYVLERYARNVGLIYQRMEILHSQCIATEIDCDDQTWAEKADKGFVVELSLIDYE